MRDLGQCPILALNLGCFTGCRFICTFALDRERLAIKVISLLLALDQ